MYVARLYDTLLRLEEISAELNWTLRQMLTELEKQHSSCGGLFDSEEDDDA